MPLADRLLFPIKKRRHKVGLSPGSVVFVGEERTAPVSFRLTTYGPESYQQSKPTNVTDAVASFQHKTKDVTWLDVYGVHQTSIIETIGAEAGIPVLALEDIVNTGQRPKVEIGSDHVFIVAKMAYISNDQTPSSTATDGASPTDATASPGLPTRSSNGAPRSAPTSAPDSHAPDSHQGPAASEGPVADSVRVEQISLWVTSSGVISFQEVPGDVLDPLRDRIAAGRTQIRRGGPGYLAYAILDLIVDHYFVVLESLAARAETLEDQILVDVSDDLQTQVHDLRRDLVYVRRNAWPVRDVLSQLERTDSPVWPEEPLRPFVRDAYEHSVQVIDMVESLRELVGGLNELHMTQLSNRMNEVMKVLTIIGTIFIPLTFVAGIYGMNFETMPELSAPYGYPVALAVMTAIGLALVIYFRRKKWL